MLSFAPVGDRQAESGSNLRQEQKADFEPEAVRLKKLQNYLKAAHDHWNFHGAVMVADSGRVILKTGVGMADPESQAADTPATRFLIGSVTKTFTAAAIMQLVERGAIRLEDPVSKYLPEYPRDKGDRIKIQHLLSHSAGIPEIAPDLGRSRDLAQLVKPLDLLSLFKGKDLDFEPGENARYSNSGYVLLGLIIEKVAGQSYVEYIRDHILSPAGMENSGYREDYQATRDFARGASEGRDGHLVLAPYIAVLSNVSSAPAGEIGRSLAAIQFGQDYQLPESR